MFEELEGTIFPEIEARKTGMFPVDDLHSLYWEESGAPNGVPIVVLHGGPGGPFGSMARRFYDPEFYRIIYFHQRGSGSSTPLGETRRNTTQHLIADMELIRQHCGIERWIVAGGSWGSTLALAYAQEHPRACLALLLNGIFLGRRRDIAWFFEGSRDFFPEAWEAFIGFLPANHRQAYFAEYSKRIMSDDPEVHGPAVRAWSAFEASIAALTPNPALLDVFQEPRFALSYARMNIHYFSNGCFLDATPILDRMARLQGIKGILVHARYDLATAYRSAVELARKWPNAELVTVPAAGHSRLELANSRALIDAQERIRSLLGGVVPSESG
jgi:proline iminopeptidase